MPKASSSSPISTSSSSSSTRVFSATPSLPQSADPCVWCGHKTTFYHRCDTFPPLEFARVPMPNRAVCRACALFNQGCLGCCNTPRRSYRCSVCSRQTRSKCSGCSIMRYCCTRCQRRDWRSHKGKCNIEGMRAATGHESAHPPCNFEQIALVD